MPVQSVHHVNLRARSEDIRMLRDFYCNVVGLRQGWRPPFTSSGYWLYAGETPVVHLVEMQPEEAATVTGYGRSAVDHIAFRCTDRQGMGARLREHEVEYVVSEVPGTGDIQFLFRDPVGTGVELGFTSHVAPDED